MRDDGSHVVNVRWRHGEWVLVQNELLDSLEKRAQVQFTDDYNPKDDVKDECARGGAGANENRVTLNEKNICEEEWNEG